jgi:ABC-type Fe3+/spermidine/putrescine transport system ATPase subunit
MSYLELRKIRKSLGGNDIVRSLDLSVTQGEMLCLLGPSGCGKTTTLRMIAGLETADGGEIRVEGRDITRLPASERDIGVVFQNYALFPHMTVFENVAFGLEMRKLPRDEVVQRATQALALVKLGHTGERLPRQLSGGQQQRVALARALAIKPRLLLFDEPLSNLDAKLREDMRREILRVQRETRITSIFVTHDQAEALAIGDRVAVMEHGQIAQLGTPETVYARPSSEFVADFLGVSSRFDGVVERTGETTVLDVRGRKLTGVTDVALARGQQAKAYIKSERLRLATQADPDGAGNTWPVSIRAREYHGSTVLYQCEADDLTLVVSAPSDQAVFDVGSRAYAQCAAEDCIIF